MRKTPATTIAGAITLVALGAMTTFALRPVAKPAPAALPVEVRTQVVRRTVWIVKHEKPTQPHRSRTPAAAAPPHPGTTAGTTAGTTPAATTAGTAAIASAPRTTASRARTTAAGAPVPAATGVSSARPSTTAGSTVAPVTTHSSRSNAATSTGDRRHAGHPQAGDHNPGGPKPVSTKTSGAKSTSGSGSAAGTPAAKPVKTRTQPRRSRGRWQRP